MRRHLRFRRQCAATSGRRGSHRQGRRDDLHPGARACSPGFGAKADPMVDRREYEYIRAMVPRPTGRRSRCQPAAKCAVSSASVMHRRRLLHAWLDRQERRRGGRDSNGTSSPTAGTSASRIAGVGCVARSQWRSTAISGRRAKAACCTRWRRSRPSCATPCRRIRFDVTTPPRVMPQSDRYLVLDPGPQGHPSRKTSPLDPRSSRPPSPASILNISHRTLASTLSMDLSRLNRLVA